MWLVVDVVGVQPQTVAGFVASFTDKDGAVF